LTEGDAAKDERRLFKSYDSSSTTAAKLVLDFLPPIIDSGTGTEGIRLAIPFSDTITNLSDSTTYYFRAKIQDSDGNWYYGEEKQFTTEEKPYIPKTVTDANLVTTENISIKVFALVSDTNLITTEIISIDKTLALTDLSTSIEVVNIIAEVSIADSGISTDVISIDVALTVPDSGIGIEDVKVSKILILTDSGHGIDIISIVGRISVTDFTVGVEIIGVTTQLLVPDSSSWPLREFW
jgi:hypothetical protein